MLNLLIQPLGFSLVGVYLYDDYIAFRADIDKLDGDFQLIQPSLRKVNGQNAARVF